MILGIRLNRGLALTLSRYYSSARPVTQDKLSYYHKVGSLPLVYRTIGRQLEITAEKYPSRIAVVSCHEGQSLTYPELLYKANKLAAALIDLGIGKGDRVGIWMPNMNNWYISFMAVARIGAVSVLLNPAYQVPEIDYCIGKVEMKALIAAEEFKTQNYYHMLSELLPEMSTVTSSAKIANERLPSIERVIIDTDKKLSGALQLRDLINSASESEVRQINALQSRLSPDIACNIQFTSGTTGHPKAATLTHYNFVNNGMHIGQNQGFDRYHDKVCVQVPLFHAYGTVIAVMAALGHGATLCLPAPGFHPPSSIKCVKEQKCSYIYGTPTMYVDLVSHLKQNHEHLESLKFATIGGAPCSPKLLEDMIEYLGIERVKSVFGMTETSAVIFQSIPLEARDRPLNFVGQVQEHTEAKVVDADGNLVPFGTPGELCIRGYSNMLGYYNDDEKTNEMIGRDGWLRTGDQFVLHEDGFGQIVGRLKDMIIRGGENIFPKEIEDFLDTHPDIIETHVIGVPDERLGEEVAAFVRLSPKVTTITRDEIKSFSKGKIAHFKIPKYVIPVTDFPKTVSGKIQKYKLRESFDSFIRDKN